MKVNRNIGKKLNNTFGYYKIQGVQNRKEYFGGKNVAYKNKEVNRSLYDEFGRELD